ncbi:MAG TPA: hypothetical protein V6D15_14300 [Oculatellaceae cyanobacterium]|jgi:hypothetical protein
MKKPAPEKYYRDLLCNKLQGRIEVEVKVSESKIGKIDILTEHELIEVKPFYHWKSALGQLLAYSYLYRNHIKRLHLIGEPETSSKLAIENVCEYWQVITTFQPIEKMDINKIKIPYKIEKVVKAYLNYPEIRELSSRQVSEAIKDITGELISYRTITNALNLFGKEYLTS